MRGPARLLLRLLPAEWVEQIVVPAYGDLALSIGRRPGALAATGLVLTALWVGLPVVVWHRRRPTTVGGVLLTLGLMTLVVVYLRNRGLYDGPPPQAP